MIHRVASVLLVVALVLAGGSEPFRHMRPTRRSPRPRLAVGVATPGLTNMAPHLARTLSYATDITNSRSHSRAVTSPGVRVGATPALVGFVMAGIVPDFSAGTAFASSGLTPRLAANPNPSVA